MRGARFRRLLCCGVIGAVFFGTMTAAGPSAQAATTPRLVNIVVVPPLAGVNFTLDGVAGITAAGGAATMQVTTLAGAASNLAVDKQIVGTDQVSQDRVVTDPNHGAFSRKLVVELDVNRQVTINFLTPQQKVLSPKRVDSVILTDSLGGTTRLTKSQLAKPIWLPASRPARVANGFTGRFVTYSVKSVMIRGSNVVNSGQRRFTTNRSLSWTIPVILHSLTIDANDLLAGAPAGNSVQVTFPNGTKETAPFGAHHRVTLTDLPRGTYRLKVNGGLIPLASTVHLSRDQTATELVITTVDFAEMVAIVLVVIAVVVAAGVIGRRRRHEAGRIEADESQESEESHEAGQSESGSSESVDDDVLV
jgi:hypothetical protein